MSVERETREHDADRARDALLATLSELDRRRHHVFDWRAQLQGERPRLWIPLAAGTLVGAAAWLWWRRKQRLAPHGWMRLVDGAGERLALIGSGRSIRGTRGLELKLTAQGFWPGVLALVSAALPVGSALGRRWASPSPWPKRVLRGVARQTRRVVSARPPSPPLPK